MSCGVGCRYGLDLALLWLWCRQAAAALIRPLAWDPPYAEGVALKRQKKKKQKTKNLKDEGGSPAEIRRKVIQAEGTAQGKAQMWTMSGIFEEQ